MKKISWPVLIYAILLMGLGYLGYQEAGSKMSLYSGVGSGAVLLICSRLMYAGNRTGAYIALMVTALLTAVFSVRYSNTGKELPAVLAVLSAGMLIFLLVRVVPRKR